MKYTAEQRALAISLRKEGKSYSEIKSVVGMGKSNLNYIFQKEGLTSLSEHEDLCRDNSRRLHGKDRQEETMKDFASRIYFNSFNVMVISLYAGEGAKYGNAGIANKDWRIIDVFSKFINLYELSVQYRLYIHEIRSDDLEDILNYWVDKLNVPKEEIRISWKRNISKGNYEGKEYWGVVGAVVRGVGSSAITKVLNTAFDKLVTTDVRQAI